jgi:aminotransferase in exopolysaccharide biosynthesis
MIPLSVPHISGNEWTYVKDCLDTGWVSSAGSYVDRFERAICGYTGARYAVGCANGTAALQVALRLVGVVPGDEVIVPTLTFIAPVNAARYMGAEPVFMDCDDCYGIDAEKTADFILKETFFRGGQTRNRKTGRRVSAIVPVHVFGNAAALERIVSICRERNIRIVEDAAESMGTCYTSGSLHGRFTGTVGEIGCYSFNGNKIITTGGGGMLVTDRDEYAGRARYLTTQAKDDPIRYIHHEVGYNFRLANIPAAIGVAQLEKLPEFLETKKRNYLHYARELRGLPGLRLAEPPDYARCNHWFYCLQIDAKVYGRDRDSLMAHLSAHGVETRPVWYPNHLQRPYKDCQGYRIEKALGLHEKTLNIPCSVGLDRPSIDKVIGLLKNE